MGNDDRCKVRSKKLNCSCGLEECKNVEAAVGERVRVVEREKEKLANKSRADKCFKTRLFRVGCWVGG